MHILFLTDNFPPEGNAPATRTYEHAKEWVKAGHQVTVITCAPNFPEGKVYQGYRNAWYQSSDMAGIRVIRVKSYISANKGFLLRILDFMSFMVTSFFAGLFVKKIDVVVATSPQFFTAVSGWALSAVKRKKFVFELRDIWPASITAVGAMKKSIAIKWLEKLELFLYKRADLIVSVTHAFKSELVERGVDKSKIQVVLNGVDLDKYQPIVTKSEKFLTQFGLTGKFVVGYIGTHGMAHGLEKVIAAAELLNGSPEIQFVFAGGGAEREKLQTLAIEKGLKNVTFIPRQPKENMPELWTVCDISLISLKDAALFKTVIPSKIFESMGMGLPMLGFIPKGEATDILERYKAGYLVSPENEHALAVAIETIKNDKNLYNELANNSLRAAKSFDRKALAMDMLGYLEQ